MKAPCPKLRTSIRPNTRVRPLAITKIIMPMARAAMVSVIQVLTGTPCHSMIASAAMASPGSSNSGRMSRRATPIGASLAAGATGSAGVAVGWCAGVIRAASGGQRPALRSADASWLGPQRQAEEARLRDVVPGQRGHAVGMHDLTVVHDH